MPKRIKRVTKKQYYTDKIKTSKKPKEGSTEREQLNWKIKRPFKHSQNNINFLKSQKKITADILKNKCKITYLFDAINQIALAKNIVIDSIPTPFGKCDFKKLKGDNYLAKITGVAQAATSYKVLLGVINNSAYKEDYKKKIRNFIELKVDNDFDINTPVVKGMPIKKQLCTILEKKMKCSNCSSDCADGEVLFSAELSKKKFRKKFTITYNQAASLLCGIFAISETVRFGGSGKLVRSANRGAGILDPAFFNTFPQAGTNGTMMMMSFITERTHEKKMEHSLNETVKNISPDSTLLEQESPKKGKK